MKRRGGRKGRKRRKGKNYNKGYYKDYHEDDISDEESWINDADGKIGKKSKKDREKEGSKGGKKRDDRPIKVLKKRPHSYRHTWNKWKPDREYPKSLRELEKHELPVFKFTKYTTFDKLFGKKWEVAVNKMMIRKNIQIQQEMAIKAEELKKKLAFLKGLEWDVSNEKNKIGDYNNDLDLFKKTFA